jgi:translation initiation factor 3 subunit H
MGRTIRLREAVEQDDGADYQIAMMRCLREVRSGFSCVGHGQRPSVRMQVNVDNNTVGWYQSTYLGSFLNETMIETQFTYQARLCADPLRCTSLRSDSFARTSG